MKTMSSEHHRAAEQEVRNEERLEQFSERYTDWLLGDFFPNLFKPEDIRPIYNQRREL